MTILVKSAAVCGALVLLCGCSIKRIAVNKLGTSPASGGSTFTSDDDPELVEAAIPFGLKLYESLPAESPKHTGLLLAAAQGFTEYSYAFVDSRIDEARAESLERADALRNRARRLYFRAYGYGMRGLRSVPAGSRSTISECSASNWTRRTP